MRYFLDRNRVYLVCFYFSMSFFYLSFVLEDQDPIPMLGYILALIIFIVISHDTLLQVITQATGQISSKSELEYFSALLELNQKIHNFLEVDDVLVLVNDTLKERVHISRTVFLLAKEVQGVFESREDDDDAPLLESWPDNKQWRFHDREFEAYIENNPAIQTSHDGTGRLQGMFAETDTSLLVPVVQNQKVLCVMLVGRLANEQRWSEFEIQMFTFLANQLSIILDRIRVYAKVLQKTAMDHAEKVQVMQSLSANIAHEMRTPLSGIRASISGYGGYLEQLLKAHEYAGRERPSEFPAIREDQLARLKATPKRIELMIDQANTVIDMLLMNLRENALDRKLLNPIEAADVVEQAVDRYPFKTGEREKLHLDLKQNFTFMGVESLCIYILFNLLKNAYYSIHSARKGEIVIQLRCSGDKNLIVFRDTGMGIDPHIRSRIFDGFFTTKSDGTGAGLAFCKRTIRDFNGDISCDSELGEYAEFRILLPALRSGKP